MDAHTRRLKGHIGIEKEEKRNEYILKQMCSFLKSCAIIQTSFRVKDPHLRRCLVAQLSDSHLAESFLSHKVILR